MRALSTTTRRRKKRHNASSLRSRALLFEPRGITLLELLIVITIVAGMTVGSVYMMGLITHGQLKDEAMRLTSTVQYTSNQAALNNRHYRLVIDLDSHEYYTEVTDSEVVIDSGSDEAIDAFEEGIMPEELREMEAERNAQRSGMFREEEDDPFGISRRTGYQRAEDAIVEPRTLRNGMQFVSVRTEARPHAVTEGRVAISFFPSGLQQQAVVLLTDPSSGAMFTLITEPLTGRVHAYSGEREGPDDLGEEEYDG